MAELLHAIILWVENLITQLGYPGLALAMFLETVFPPIPSEAIMPFAGLLARRGVFSLGGVIVAASVGAVLGALVLYAVGRWVEERVLFILVARHGRWVGLSEDNLRQALRAFDRHGLLAVFIGRLLPGLRSVISLPAGMARMRLSTFIFMSTLGTVAWNSLLAWLGWALGDQWEVALQWIARYEEITIIVVVLAGAAYVGWRLYRRGADAPPSALA